MTFLMVSLLLVVNCLSLYTSPGSISPGAALFSVKHEQKEEESSLAMVKLSLASLCHCLQAVNIELEVHVRDTLGITLFPCIPALPIKAGTHRLSAPLFCACKNNGK